MFGESALRCAALAARALGWRPRDFWAATPAELAVCLASPNHTKDASVDRAELHRMVANDRGE